MRFIRYAKKLLWFISELFMALTIELFHSGKGKKTEEYIGGTLGILLGIFPGLIALLFIDIFQEFFVTHPEKKSRYLQKKAWRDIEKTISRGTS